MNFQPDARYIDFLNWDMPLDVSGISGVQVLLLEMVIRKRTQNPDFPWVEIDDNPHKIVAAKALERRGLVRVSQDTAGGGYVVESIIF